LRAMSGDRCTFDESRVHRPQPTAFKPIAAMTDKTSVTKGSPDLPEALDKREFSVSRKGYDKKEVKAFLAEIEANFRELEKWAEQTKTRLAIAEEKVRGFKQRRSKPTPGSVPLPSSLAQAFRPMSTKPQPSCLPTLNGALRRSSQTQIAELPR